MNNESPMHKAFTSYMHDCGCGTNTTQLSNNEEDDILVLPTDEPGLDVTVLSNDIVTNLGYKGYVPIYFQPHSIFEALKQSMEEESVAFDWYVRRQIYSKDNNDEKSAKLWGEIAADEEEHYIKFGKRILETSGKDALSGVMADMPFRVPLSKISVVGSGIEPGDDITAFTGSYPGKKINKGEALVQDLVDAGWIIKGNYSNQETAMQVSSDIIYKENHPTQVINRMPIAYTVLYLSNTKYR